MDTQERLNETISINIHSVMKQKRELLDRKRDEASSQGFVRKWKLRNGLLFGAATLVIGGAAFCRNQILMTDEMTVIRRRIPGPASADAQKDDDGKIKVGADAEAAQVQEQSDAEKKKALAVDQDTQKIKEQIASKPLSHGDVEDLEKSDANYCDETPEKSCLGPLICVAHHCVNP